MLWSQNAWARAMVSCDDDLILLLRLITTPSSAAYHIQAAQAANEGD